MNINRLRSRLSVHEQLLRDPHTRYHQLGVECRSEKSGEIMRATDVVNMLVHERTHKRAKNFDFTASRVQFPEFVNTMHMPLSAMKRPITVRQFLRFLNDTRSVMRELGDLENRIKAFMHDTANLDKSMPCLTIYDARRYSSWMSGETGRNIFVPKLNMLKQIRASGKIETLDLFELAEIESGDKGNCCARQNLFSNITDYQSSSSRLFNSGVRLFELARLKDWN